MEKESEYLSDISSLESHAYEFIMNKKDKDYSKYFGKALNIFSEIFEKILRNNYIFCSISYLTKTGNTYIIQPLDYLGKGKEDISKEPCITDLLYFVKANPKISLTHTLVRRDEDKDILFYRSRININIMEYKKSLYKVNFSDFTDDYETNEYLIANNSFKENFIFFNDPDTSTVTELLTHYKKIADIYSGYENDAFFYFIKPATKKMEEEFGVIASIAVSRPLNQLELAFINLLLGKVLYEPQLLDKEREKNKINEQMETLKNISASTHAIKTLINTNFSPPLNSLSIDSKFKNDDRIKILNESKDRLLRFAELINLMSKLSIPNQPQEEINKYLISTGLYSEQYSTINLKAIIEEIKLTRAYNPIFDKIQEEYVNEDNLLIDSDFMKYNNLYPTSDFFSLLLNTTIENIFEHGLKENPRRIKIDYNNSKKIIEITNPLRRVTTEDKRMNEYTGNFRIFEAITKFLKIGKFDAFQPKNCYHFLFQIKSF